MPKFIAATVASLIIVIASQSHAASPSSGESRESMRARPAVERVEGDSGRTQARPTIRLSQAEHRLVKAVNAYRERHDLPPLAVDPILMSEARQSAPHFSHQIGGRWCWHRCRARGFRGWATDDIANGYPTPEDAVQGWATSHGHAMQMKGFFKMNGRWQNYRFNRIGVGIAGRKYIAIFGRDESGPRGG